MSSEIKATLDAAEACGMTAIGYERLGAAIQAKGDQQ